MTKAELIVSISKEAGLTRRQATRALNAATAAIQDALRHGDRVALVGFGTFTVARRADRVGRNPRTGQSIKIPARRVAVFKPGRRLAEAL